MLRVDRFAAHVALASTKNRYYSIAWLRPSFYLSLYCSQRKRRSRDSLETDKTSEDFEFSSAGDFAIERKNRRNYVQRKIFRPKRKGWHLCTSSIVQKHYTQTTLFYLHLRKSFSIEDRRTLSPKAMHHVCCFCWYRRILSWAVVVWSEFVFLVTCILPPLRHFLAATYHRRRWIQTRHIGRWLTSVKFWCKVDVHWFNKLFWPIRTDCTLQPRKWLEKCKWQQTITPHQCSTIGFADNELTFIHVAISALYGNSVSVFWEIQVYIRTASQYPY